MNEHIKVSNRRLWMHKGVNNADFSAEHILAKNPWLYVELWLNRNSSTESLSYWQQARRFADASEGVPVEARPLLLYYCFLNAAKALLICKKFQHGNDHGVTGDRPHDARASLANEVVKFKSGGVLPALCRYFGESATEEQYSLSDLFWNVPFIHRAYRLTYTSKPELFIPLERACYMRKAGSSEAWFEAQVIPRFSDTRRLSNLPSSFEIFDMNGDRYVRRKKRFKWFNGRSSQQKLVAATLRLQNYHAQTRRVVVSITGNRDLWYLKKQNDQNKAGGRHTVLLMFAAMHRLSELARYDPAGLDRHMSGKANWLISEFVEGSLDQFIDQIATEITGCQFWPPKMR